MRPQTARGWYELLGILPKKSEFMNANTHGPNRFREVLVRCLECNETQETNMQCDTGQYQWECDQCGGETTHEVTESEPLKN